MRVTGGRHPFQNDYKVAFRSDGTITALRAGIYSDGGAYADLSTAVLARAMTHIDNAYYIANADITGAVCRTNTPPNTAFHGFGGPQGVTTIEIKSGYGLDTANEAKMLRVARRLGCEGIDVRTTFLGAHALPPEFAGRADEYIDFVCNEMLPAVAHEGLADAVDAFCEHIAFSPAQTRRVFERARELGLPVKLHADQLSDLGGAALAAEFGARSAEHLEHTSEDGVRAMAARGTVATIRQRCWRAVAIAAATSPPPSGSRSELPIDQRSAFQPNGFADAPAATTPDAPAASATRTIAPTLPGSWMSTAMTTSGEGASYISAPRSRGRSASATIALADRTGLIASITGGLTTTTSTPRCHRRSASS